MSADGSLPVRTFGRYQLRELVAVSGMGVVYRAWDPTLTCVVAIKLVSEDTIPDESARRQLYIEAQIASSLNHSNICRIKDVIEESGQAGIVMEFVEGRVLTNAIPANVGLPFELVVEYGIQIADAISHAHEHNVIHRDLKSGNVMLNREGQIKLLDFGLSKIQYRSELTNIQSLNTRDSSEAIVGTPPYWAPEVLKHHPSDPRSDIWSFGVLLYEMASGQMPFKGSNIIELGSAILQQPPSPLPEQVPATLSKIIYRCLRKDVLQRYQHVNEVKAALEAIDPNSNLSSPRPSRVPYQMPIRSVAVLPLQNLSGASEQDYFADGLTESLITALAKIGGLHVISRTSIMQYKHAPKTLPQIARELNVDAVVEGSVRRDGNRVRITAELIEAHSDRHLWTETYDRDLRDILSLQSQVAAAIASEVRAKLNPVENRSIESSAAFEIDNLSSSDTVDSLSEIDDKSGVVNPKAYDLYLKGRYFWNNQATVEDFGKAISYYSRAIEVDSQSALTYAGLAHCLFLMGAGEYGFQAPSEVMPKSREAAIEALRIDESIAEAHLSLAMVKFRYDWDWEGAEKELKAAIESNHGYYVAHYLYTVYLLVLGRFEEAFREATTARQLSPLSPDVHFSIGLLLYASGQNDEAIEHLRKTVAMDNAFPLPHLALGLTFGRKGMFDEAIAEFKLALTIAGPRPLWLGYLGQAYALAGNTDEAVKILADLHSISKDSYVPPVAFAIVYAGLARTEEAFHWLKKAVEGRDGLLIYLKVGSVFDGLRTDPRFPEILANVGLQVDPTLKVEHPHPRPKVRKYKHIPDPRPPQWLILARMLLVVSAVILIVWFFWPSRQILAIQPFKTLGSDPDARRLGEIAREEIFTRLSELHPQKLGVVQEDSELSVEQVCAKPQHPTLLLAGAIRRDGDQMAITDQLVSCRDQTGMAGDRHAISPSGAGMSTAVDEIVQKVLAALPNDVRPPHQVNSKAYEAYLLGRFEWNLRSTQSLNQAISYFRQAIEYDASYAPSYAGLADCYALLGSAPYTAMSPNEAFPVAKANAQKAIQLDPNLAEAHVSLGYSALVYDRDFPVAEKEFKQALTLRPDYATAHQYYAYYLTAMGNVSEAIAERKRAVAIEPKSPLLNTALGEAYYQARQFGESLGPNQQALAIDPHYADAIINIGRAFEQLGKYPEAQHAYQSILAFAPHEPALLSLLGHLYAVTGRAAEAREIISQLQEMRTGHYVPGLYTALIYIGLGDKDQAFAWLEKADEERCEYLVYLPTDPMADPLRNDSRFVALLTHLGLKK